METLTLSLVTSSNVFGVLPVYSLIKTQRYYGALLTSSAVIASIFMHATETKHNLPGLLLKEYSNLFLNIDRVIAYATGLYGLYLFWTNPIKKTQQIITPFIGAVSCAIGESTNNLPMYTFFHIIWHVLAYYSISLVNH